MRQTFLSGTRAAKLRKNEAPQICVLRRLVSSVSFAIGWFGVGAPNSGVGPRWIMRFVIPGGGHSSGCGRESPEDGAWASNSDDISSNPQIRVRNLRAGADDTAVALGPACACPTHSAARALGHTAARKREARGEGFARFLPVVGLMHGQTMNQAALARDAGVARQTIAGYLQILEDTAYAR